MARPIKRTVDYFSHDANASNCRTITILENHFGLEGYAIWFKLLETLSVTNNHVIDIRNSADLDYLSGKMRIKPERLIQILNKLAELQAIDSALWSHKIIWCQNFIDRLSYVYERRSDPTPQKPNIDNNGVIVYNNPIIETKERTKTHLLPHSNTQSKVKESKVNNNTPKSPTEFSENNGDVFSYYEKYIGTLKDTTANWLKDLEDEYSSEWVLETLRIMKIKGTPTRKNIEALLEQAKKSNRSPEEVTSHDNGRTPKELEKYVLGIISDIEQLTGIPFTYHGEAYSDVLVGVRNGYTSEDFIGCTKGMLAQEFWQSHPLCQVKSIVKQLGAYKAGRFTPQQPKEAEKRYSVEDYLPKEDHPKKQSTQ